jgi:hypothetical protein
VRLGKRFDPPDNVRDFTEELARYFTSELSGRNASVAVAQRGPTAVGNAPHLRG